MDLKKAYEFAVEKASFDFGSDILEKINNNIYSSAVYRLGHVRQSLDALANVFEAQTATYANDFLEHMDEFHGYVKELMEGDGEEIRGMNTRLTTYFYNQELKRDPEKKRAIALFLKYYIEYLRDNVRAISIDDYLELIEEKRYNGNFFDKNFLFGDLLAIAEKNT